MLKYSKKSNISGRGVSDLQDDGVLVGRVDRREPVALVGERAGADLGVAHAQQVVLDVVAGELAAGVELDALAQVELDLLGVGAQLPALGQLRLGLELVVVARSGGRRPARQTRTGWEQDVDFEAGQVADDGGAQRAALLHLCLRLRLRRLTRRLHLSRLGRRPAPAQSVVRRSRPWATSSYSWRCPAHAASSIATDAPAPSNRNAVRRVNIGVFIAPRASEPTPARSSGWCSAPPRPRTRRSPSASRSSGTLNCLPSVPMRIDRLYSADASGPLPPSSSSISWM